MPLVHPEHAGASWPDGEGTIGVVGVAPWATLDFCRKVYALTRAVKDWDYPRLVVDANSKIPSRGRYLDLGERDPSPFIKATIDELALMGATVAVVPCNTAHILFDRWGTGTKIPVLSIVEASVGRLRESNRIKAVVLGARRLVESGIYQRAILANDRHFIDILSDEQNLIDACIAQLKCSPCLLRSQLQELEAFAYRLQDSGVDAVFLACTELGMISGESLWDGFLLIDSNEALASESLKAIAPPGS